MKYHKSRIILVLCCFIITFVITPLNGYSKIKNEDKITDTNFHSNLSNDNYIQNLEVTKSNLSFAKKKMSTDLLKLIDNDFNISVQSKFDIVENMLRNKQYKNTGMVVNAIESIDTGKVYVYIYLTPGVGINIFDRYLSEVTDRDEKNGIIVAWVELSKLEMLAAQHEVISIQTVQPPKIRSGSVTSEGDIIHRADDVRTVFGQAGAGVKIGVISDGVDNYASAVSTGDLPDNITVLRNQVGGDEGTAMLEIIYDLAPSAQLYFRDCGNNHLAFIQAVDELVAAGCKIICDDIGWLTSPYFEDGIVAQHFSSITDQSNVIFVSAAGNDGNSKHYQGLYYNDGYDYHDFSRGGSNTNFLNLALLPGESIDLILQWDDKWGTSGNDYDLILRDADTYSIVEYSIYLQTGSDNPLEFISFTNNGYTTFYGLVDVMNYNGLAVPKTLELIIDTSSGVYIYPYNLSGVDAIYGHAAVQKVIAVGAIDYPNLNDIAIYSSQGPSTISFPNSEIRNKPDISGISNVHVTGAGSFHSPFAGTSAAAPHIAAICALAWAQYPEKTAEEIRLIVLNTATDLGNSGFDFVYGYGRVDAFFIFWDLLASVIFPSDITKICGESVSISSSGDDSNNVWFAPPSTTSFQEGPTMTKAVNGTSATITAPNEPGTYKLFVIDSIGRISSPSTAVLEIVAIPDGLVFDSVTGTITDYLGNESSLLIPAEIDGVTVISIGGSAFNGCSSLTSITIPDSVTSIDQRAFAGCSGLTQIIVDGNNAAFSSQDGVLFNKRKTSLIKYPSGKTGSYIIPNSVTNIGVIAFESCVELTSVTIPNSVLYIGERAFSGCNGLSSVTIPDNVISIDFRAFMSCGGLTIVAIGSGVTSISWLAFEYCGALEQFIVDNNNTIYSSLDGVLFNKNKSTLIQYPEGKAGSSYIIPNSVISISSDAFEDYGDYCELISVTIPNSVTDISERAFSSCEGLTQIIVDNDNVSYTSQDGVLFSLTKTILINYPNGKTGSSYIVPNSVTRIGNNAFFGCSELTSITISDNVTSIGNASFFNCSRLTSMIIPNSVASIGEQTFWGCTALTSVFIGSGVTSIDYYSFCYCTELTAAYFLGNAPTMNDQVFFGCASDFTVYYLSGMTGFSNPWYGYQTELFSTYVFDDSIIRGIAPGILFEEFTAGFQLPNDYIIKVVKKDGSDLPTGSNVGTGMKMQLLLGTEIVNEYSIIIYGDTTGDGNINAIDLLGVKRCILGLQTLTDAYAVAANTDHDANGTINALDLLKIKRNILGLEVIIQ